MARYIIKRILWIIPIMLVVIIIVFTISYLAPGDPVMSVLGMDNYTPEAYAKKAAEMGLDKGYFAQLGTYIWNLVTKLELGKSYINHVPVSQELATRIPVSFRISLLGILLMIAVGLPIGMISALKQYSVLDITMTSLSLILAATPGFVLALLSALLFGVVLKWLPVTGLKDWKAWILPVACSAAGGVAVYVRMTRTTMLEVIRQDYIRTARAKGLPEGVVVRRHALKNCLIPLVTVVSAFVANVLSGSVIVETIFNIPGMGMYMMGGIQNRDYPIVNGSVLVISALVCVVNLITGISYTFIDPRIKSRFAAPKKIKKPVPAKKEVG